MKKINLVGANSQNMNRYRKVTPYYRSFFGKSSLNEGRLLRERIQRLKQREKEITKEYGNESSNTILKAACEDD